MENKRKYILIFSILFMFLTLVSVATAQEVNAATTTYQLGKEVIPDEYGSNIGAYYNGKFYDKAPRKTVTSDKLIKTEIKVIKKGKVNYKQTVKSYRKTTRKYELNSIYSYIEKRYVSSPYWEEIYSGEISPGDNHNYHMENQYYWPHVTYECDCYDDKPYSSHTYKKYDYKKITKGMIITDSAKKYVGLINNKGTVYKKYTFNRKIATSNTKFKTVKKTSLSIYGYYKISTIPKLSINTKKDIKVKNRIVTIGRDSLGYYYIGAYKVSSKTMKTGGKTYFVNTPKKTIFYVKK